MEVAPHYTLLSLFTLFTLFLLFKLLYSSIACMYAYMPIYIDYIIGRVRTLLKWADGLLSKMLDGWSGWMDNWMDT